MNTYQKIDDNTLQITKEITPAVAVLTYQYQDLRSMRDALIVEKTNFNDKQDSKIAELDEMISQADTLGIVEKVAIVKAII